MAEPTGVMQYPEGKVDEAAPPGFIWFKLPDAPPTLSSVFGGPGSQALACERCAALVVDAAVHSAWHEVAS